MPYCWSSPLTLPPDSGCHGKSLGWPSGSAPLFTLGFAMTSLVWLEGYYITGAELYHAMWIVDHSDCLYFLLLLQLQSITLHPDSPAAPPGEIQASCRSHHRLGACVLYTVLYGTESASAPLCSTIWIQILQIIFLLTPHCTVQYCTVLYR